MKKIIILFILFSFNWLFAENIIPKNILTQIRDMTDKKTFVKYNDEQNTEFLYPEILEFLISNNCRLVYSENSNPENILLIEINTKTEILNNFQLFKGTKTKKTNYFIVLKKIDPQSDEILMVKNFNFSTEEKKVDKFSYKWYDPILISTLLGGLIYLFYFGE